MQCNPTKRGIVLRLFIASLLITYGVTKVNYIVLVIGMVPIVRLGFYFLSK